MFLTACAPAAPAATNEPPIPTPATVLPTLVPVTAEPTLAPSVDANPTNGTLFPPNVTPVQNTSATAVEVVASSSPTGGVPQASPIVANATQVPPTVRIRPSPTREGTATNGETPTSDAVSSVSGSSFPPTPDFGRSPTAATQVRVAAASTLTPAAPLSTASATTPVTAAPTRTANPTVAIIVTPTLAVTAPQLATAAGTEAATAALGAVATVALTLAPTASGIPPVQATVIADAATIIITPDQLNAVLTAAFSKGRGPDSAPVATFEKGQIKVTLQYGGKPASITLLASVVATVSGGAFDLRTVAAEAPESVTTAQLKQIEALVRTLIELQVGQATNYAKLSYAVVNVAPEALTITALLP